MTAAKIQIISLTKPKVGRKEEKKKEGPERTYDGYRVHDGHRKTTRRKERQAER
jgi:hypothetical protein